MTATIPERRETRRSAARLPLLLAGLGATTLTTGLALLDPVTTGLLAAQIRTGYPGYGPAEISRAVTVYVGLLVGTGLLGVIGWLTTMLLIRTGKRGVRWLAPLLWAAGLIIALTALLTPDTSGATGMAPVFGLLLLAPCVPGLPAVVLIWRDAQEGGAHV